VFTSENLLDSTHERELTRAEIELSTLKKVQREERVWEQEHN